MSVEFTQKQIDHICYEIGEWYMMIKPLLEGQHNLGYMKEKLKTMICGEDRGEVSWEHKTELEKLRDANERIDSLLKNVLLVLGIVHGGIGATLEGRDEDMREKLTDIFKKASKDINELLYQSKIKF